jgi:hypothetical protein
MAIEECHASRVEIVRKAVIQCSGIDEEAYQQLVTTDEIVEKTNGAGLFPPSANVVSCSDGGSTFMDTEIIWGSTGYNCDENKDHHDMMICCECIMTRVTCWIESLDLVVAV